MQTTEAAPQAATLQSALQPSQNHELIELRDEKIVDAAPANSPAAMMLAAMQRGASLEQIEKMMDLQDRWEKREAEKAFRDAFAGFRGENVIIPKTKNVDRGKAGSFMQAEYDEVCRRLSPALSRYGFGFRHDQRFGLKQFTDGDGVQSHSEWVWVTCFLEHRLGHMEKLELEGPAGDLSANTAVQNMQATASFLKRQSLLAITGTSTGGEDDESKLRKARQGDGEQEPSDDAALLDAGKSAADRGVGELNKWWATLTARQRTDLSPEFGGMRKHARAVDEQRGAA